MLELLIRGATVYPGDGPAFQGDVGVDGRGIALVTPGAGDGPAPEASVPGLLALIEGDLPSGRYEAADLIALAEEAAA